MPITYTLISSQAVGVGGASSISFNSIPQSYTDLLIKVSAKNTGTLSTTGQYYLMMQLNSSTSIGNLRAIVDNSGSVTSNTNGASSYTKVGWTTDSRTSSNNIFSNTDIYLTNYTSSNYKVVSAETASETNDSYGFLDFSAVLFSTTSAVSSVTLYPETNNFSQYTTAYLYGIKNA